MAGEKKRWFVAYDTKGNLIMATDPETLEQVPKVLKLTPTEVQYPIVGVREYKRLEVYQREHETARRAEGWEWINDH